MADRKILIVDDEKPIRALLRCAVSAPGCAVFEAESGAEALAIAAAEAPFTLVITDVLMPGMDGIDLARSLARAGQAERFLFISGYCDPESMLDRMRDFTCSAFLAKPFSIPDLLREAEELMAERPGKARSASVREQGRRSALRRPAAPVETVRALRRRAARLRSRRELLVEEARRGLRLRAFLLGQIESQIAAIGAIQRWRPTHRAML